jgi:hypothetical protein
MAATKARDSASPSSPTDSTAMRGILEAVCAKTVFAQMVIAASPASAAPPKKPDELAPFHVLSSSRGSHPTTSLKKLCCASQHFGSPNFCNGSFASVLRYQHFVRFVSGYMLNADNHLEKGVAPLTA